MYSWIKPSIIIPVHGEALHIKAQAELAKKFGIPFSIVTGDVDIYPKYRLGLDLTNSLL